METNVVVLAFFIARPNFRLITLKLWFSYDFFHGNAVFILFIVTTMYKRNRQPLNQFKWFFVVRYQWTVISMRGISFESIQSSQIRCYSKHCPGKTPFRSFVMAGRPLKDNVSFVRLSLEICQSHTRHYIDAPEFSSNTSHKVAETLWIICIFRIKREYNL